LTRRAPHNRLLDAWNLLSRGWKAAVGFVAGLGVILGFVFHPPWAGGSSSKGSSTTTDACPGDVVGSISGVTIDPQPIPLAAYWQLHPGSKPKNASPDRGRTLGRVVRFHFEVSNYPQKPLGVTWWMLNPRGEPVSAPKLEYTVTPGSCKTTKVTRDFWAELPRRAGKYRVQIELDAGTEQLDLARTKIFTVVS
jgi:hypothetical protein